MSRILRTAQNPNVVTNESTAPSSGENAIAPIANDPIDEMSLEYFYGPGKAIEITKYDGASDEVITATDMHEACANAGVDIEDGDILLVNTGHYEEHYPTKAYVDDYIGFSREAAEWMVEKGVKNFGVDAPGPGRSRRGRADRSRPVSPPPGVTERFHRMDVLYRP